MNNTSFAVVSPTNLHDNGYVTDVTNYLLCNPYSRWVFYTHATNLFIKTYCNMFDTFPDYSTIGIIINGTYFTTLTCTQMGANNFSLVLPARGKKIEIIAGVQTKPAATVLGTFIKSIYFSGGAYTTEVSPTNPASRLFIYGDSIAVGDHTEIPTKEGWAVLMRSSINTAIEAFGYRSLFMDCETEELRAAFVSHIAAFEPLIIWLAIGTNDYGLSKWTAANFGTAYADLLDKLHVALPSTTIYAQTPTTRTTETANALGSTLPDYRTQIATAQSTRSEYCTLVDGTEILVAGDLADGLHPTTAGHAKYATYVKSALGLT